MHYVKRQKGSEASVLFGISGHTLAPSVGWPWTEPEASQSPVLTVPGSRFKLGESRTHTPW